MRHRNKVKKLGRTRAHRQAMLRNMVSALFTHERIQTTLPKAKEARRFAERMIGFARKNTLAARRQAVRFISDKALVKKLFDIIGPRFADRDGGYTRVYRLGPREGDGAEMALLELVVREQTHKEKKEAAERTKGRGKKKGKKAAAEKKPRPKSRGGMSPEDQLRQQQMISYMMSIMFPLMFYYWPSGLNRGCRSHRHSPVYSGGA